MKNKFINKIEDIFLYKRRREKYVREMNIKIHKYLNETDDEFLLDYVDINSRYKHNKFILFIYSLMGLLIARGTWNYFFPILFKTLISEDPKIVNIKNITITLNVIFMLTIIIVITFIFIDMTRTVYKLDREQIILNEVKKMRKEK